MPAEVSFAAFVKESREKKKQQELAQQILGSRGRKANGAGALPNTRDSEKPSLLSRMSTNSGINKQRSSSARPASNIEGKWQHDLHKLNNPHGPPPKKPTRTASASVIDRNTRTYNKFQNTLERNVETPGINIKGVANGGPTTVIASNFAPGTTAADIEAVMRDHARTEAGGELVSCRLITASPTVMVELVCSDRKGADNITATFNNRKADGRLLYVYVKDTPIEPATHSRPLGRLGQSSFDDMDIEMDDGGRGSVQDGRYGFSDSRREPPRGPRRRY